MKKILIALLSSVAIQANAQTINHFTPGAGPSPGTVSISQLNRMVDQVNNLSGQTGTTTPSIINKNNTTGTVTTPLTGTDLQVLGANGATARIEVDSFGGVPIFSGSRRNGTLASPTAIVSGDQLGSFNFHGAKTTALIYGPAARYTSYATENWSSTAGGTKLVFSVTPNTTQVLTDALTVDQDGGLKGINAAQGTAVNITGGTSSTSGNAGGAVTLTGGTPGLTGVGGGVTITSGAGGATSGAAGAVAITAGSATSANGATITLTAGAGGGGTNAGGSVNLVSGAAVSTGIPGTVQINGNSALVCPSYYFTGTPAATDQVFFIATRSYLVVSASEIHSAAAGGASALQLVKDTGTDAPGAGTDLLTNNTNTGFDLSATANTVQTGTLTATIATKTLAAGNRLSVDFANAIQSSAGVVVTACLAPL